MTELKGMGMSFAKFWDASRHMIEAVISRLPSLVIAIIVFALFYSLSVVVKRVIRRSMSGRRANLGTVFGRLFGWATVLLGFLVAISIVAPSFQASDLIKVLGIGGVAIGFAFQNILQNFLAGLLLLWAEPFRVGDEIKVDIYEGKVEDIQTRATIIRTYDERRVVIPNADLFTRSVTVNTALGSRRWQYDLNLGSVVYLDELKQRILRAVREVPGVLPDPAPEAVLIEVNPDGAKLRVLWSSKDPHQHQMLKSYDQVLTAIAHALEKKTERSSAARARSESPGAAPAKTVFSEDGVR